jgi:hypothetical protein
MGNIVRNNRVAFTMWDFSWLTRRYGSEAEYANFDQILDEVVERGYNGVRIDAFPHFISYLEEDESRIDKFTILPEPVSKQWGNRSPITTSVKSPLIEFLSKCQERGIKVALSSWFVPDESNLRDTVQTPADFLRIWQITLRFIECHGFGDLIEWVDICNEFPYAAWAAPAYEHIFRTDRRNIAAFFLPWSKTSRRVAQTYIDEVLPALKQEFAYPMTFSSLRLARKEESLDVGNLDILEVHIWLSDTVRFAILSGAILSTAQLPFGARIHARIARHLYPVLRSFWLRILD